VCQRRWSAHLKAAAWEAKTAGGFEVASPPAPAGPRGVRAPRGHATGGGREPLY
jgi:hypothetical protein